MSALPLPELLTGEGKADINVKLDLRSKCISSQKPLPISCVSACSNRVHLTWGGVGDLLVEEGSQITVIPIPYADEDALRLFILGAGLGVLLHQRGLLVLHASSVGIDNRGMGFIGHKGWGKSTTTAILHQRGHALISDELLVVRFNDQGQPWVIPGSPQIRLWSDSLASTGGNPDSAVRVRSGIDKYNLYAKNIAVTALPFHCLYLLDIGEALSIQSMPPSEAFFGIIPHLYVCRFGTRFLQSTNITCAFQKLNLLLRKIKVKRLMRQWNLNQLSDVARRIEQDILQDQQLV